MESRQYSKLTTVRGAGLNGHGALFRYELTNGGAGSTRKSMAL